MSGLPRGGLWSGLAAIFTDWPRHDELDWTSMRVFGLLFIVEGMRPWMLIGDNRRRGGLRMQRLGWGGVPDDAEPHDDMEVHEKIGLSSYQSDILARGLDVIFCGLNPASSAAIAGHNFSNGTNRFWTALHLAGFTDLCLQPQDEWRLLEYGCGLTAVVRRPTKRAAEISSEEFRQARRGFEAKMRHYAPRSIAFLGKRALSTMIGRPDVDWGRLPIEFAGTMAWLLPNPSGLNRGFTRDALVSAYRELRIALAQSSIA
jgi:TDG/mug DNA glycosylase family protein